MRPNLKSYHIPHDCRSYRREPRPYTPRPQPPKGPTQRRLPAPKLVFFNPVLPKVSKLKPLQRYRPVKLSALPSGSQAKYGGHKTTRHDEPRAAVVRQQDQTEQRARLQQQHREDQQARQLKHQRQQEAVRQQYLRQQQELQRQSQQKKQGRGSGGYQGPPNQPPHQTSRTTADDRNPPQRHDGTREQTKEAIRKKLMEQLEADKPNPDAPTKRSSCTGNVVTFLIIGIFLYFTFCSGLIDDLWRELQIHFPALR